MTHHKSLKAKILFGFVSISFFTLAAGAISFVSLKDITEKTEHIAKVNLSNSIALGEMRAQSKDIRIQMNRIVLNANEDLSNVREKVAEDIAIYEKQDHGYSEVPFVEGEAELYQPVNDRWKELLRHTDKLLKLSQSGAPDWREQFRKILTTDFRQTQDAHNKAIKALTTFQISESDKWRALAERSERQGALWSLMAVLGSFVFAVVSGILFSGKLSRALSALAHRLEKGASEVAVASRQVSEASGELSAGATQQSAAVQETVTSMEEISSMVTRNAENAERGRQASLSCQESAGKGRQVVQEMRASIQEIDRSNEEITKQVERSNEQMSEIVKVIAEIGNKTKVINDIVFQTKLLSFNASVEAARAGEHGKGFAVVAEEVGNLAQMSGNAAREISQMLEGSIRKVEAIAEETKTKVAALVHQSHEKVQSGAGTAERCSQMLEEINLQVASVTALIGEIATAGQEQARGVQEVNRAMTQFDQVTQQNAVASRQSAGAAEELTHQSLELKGVVEALLEEVEGSRARSAPKNARSGQVIPLRPTQAEPSPEQAQAAPPLSKTGSL